MGPLVPTTWWRLLSGCFLACWRAPLARSQQQPAAAGVGGALLATALPESGAVGPGRQSAHSIPGVIGFLLYLPEGYGVQVRSRHMPQHARESEHTDRAC